MQLSKEELDFLALFAQEELEQDIEGPAHEAARQNGAVADEMVTIIEAYEKAQGKDDSQDLIDRPVPSDTPWPWNDSQTLEQRKYEARSILNS